jgi:hypothetical protein
MNWFIVRWYSDESMHQLRSSTRRELCSLLLDTFSFPRALAASAQVQLNRRAIQSRNKMAAAPETSTASYIISNTFQFIVQITSICTCLTICKLARAQMPSQARWRLGSQPRSDSQNAQTLAIIAINSYPVATNQYCVAVMAKVFTAIATLSAVDLAHAIIHEAAACTATGTATT